MSFLSGLDPHLVLSGMGVGLIVGMTGVGGGALMTPILLLFFGIHPVTAVGSDLLYAAVTKTAGTTVHHRFNHTVDWRIVLRLAAGSVPAAAACILVLHLTGPETPQIKTIITTVLGGAVILTAITLVFRRKILDYARRRYGEIGPGNVHYLTTLLGVALGTLVTLSSVGAGAFGVTVLLFLYPRLPTARIVGSDIAHAVPLTLVAGLGHWWLGAVDWQLLASLVCGSLPGVVIGSLTSSRIPERVLDPVLACILFIAGGMVMF